MHTISAEKSFARIRQSIHQNPELSGNENATANYIRSFFSQYSGYTVRQDLGLQSLLVYKSFGSGSNIAFRAELDALPIIEKGNLEYKSNRSGISHACGHDGHMSILLALSQKIEQSAPKNGTVFYLFQSAEETGEGAESMVSSGVLESYEIDRCYALHNIPGKPLGMVLTRDKSFACASVGAKIFIEGKTAHAAHPENAINPLILALDLMSELNLLLKSSELQHFAIATPIALHSGLQSFGTSPADAEYLTTLRAEKTDDLDYIMNYLTHQCQEIEAKTEAKIQLTFQEYFPATENADASELLHKVAKANNLISEKMVRPFRWSEDFAHFSKLFPTYMFGLGSGEKCAPLHAPNYDFPDALIDIGAEIFYSIFNQHTLSEPTK